ncbi:MAG: STAS domain-containing protein [Caldilineales bacterium]
MEPLTEFLSHCVVVQPQGPLNRSTVQPLEDALTRLIEQGQRHLVLDLSEVSEISSAGLRIIISAARRLRGQRVAGDLRLAAPGRRITQVLELAGLLPVLHVFTDRDQAIASFAPPDVSATAPA